MDSMITMSLDMGEDRNDRPVGKPDHSAERESGPPEPIDRTVVGGSRDPAQGPAHPFGRSLELLLDPELEGVGVESRRLLFGRDLEPRIDAGLHGTFAEKVGAESVDRPDPRLLEAGQDRRLLELQALHPGGVLHARVQHAAPHPVRAAAGCQLRAQRRVPDLEQATLAFRLGAVAVAVLLRLADPLLELLARQVEPVLEHERAVDQLIVGAR